MLCTVKVKLLTTPEQFVSLKQTMKQFNAACNFASAIAFEKKVFGQVALHRECYYSIRDKFGLSSQFAVRAVGKVTESYRSDKKRLHTFKETGSVVYDQRILSFKGLDIASLLTVNGRIKVPIIIGAYQQGVLAGRRIRGQADLILQNEKFFLLLVVELPDCPPGKPKDFLGIDLGIVNIATTSDGEKISGEVVRGIRRRHVRLRKKLQKKGSKSAKKLLKQRHRKELRFATDINHCISKKIVSIAKDTQRGIAMEDLNGIRDRVSTVRKAQRVELSSWAFYQLRQFVTYKAILAGVAVVFVDPRNTSRTCPECGNIDKKNRPSQEKFKCTCCGFSGHADIIAAGNIASRATVNLPNVGVA